MATIAAGPRVGAAGAGWLLPACVAIALWSLAPTLAALASRVPPLQLTALCMAVACAASAPLLRQAGTVDASPAAVPLRQLLAAAALVMGAVAFYLAALRHVPAAEAALVAYTWPLFLTIAVELITTGRVRPGVVAGCVMAFGGAAALLQPDDGMALQPDPGHGLALASGLCWVGFSLLARRGQASLNRAMARVFALAAALALAGHVVLETALWPIPGDVMAWIVFIGVGPYGLAFVFWQLAVQRGPGAVVGTLAYSVPVLSTIVLIVAGMAAFDWRLPLAGLAVAGGCLLGAGPRLPRGLAGAVVRRLVLVPRGAGERSMQRLLLPVARVALAAPLMALAARRGVRHLRAARGA